MLLIAFLGGLLTILSPCILPIVPFALAWSHKSRRDTLLLLLGMAVTFALVGSLAVLSSEWIIHANQVGRWIALSLMAVFAISLLSPRVAAMVMQPFGSAGNRLNSLAGTGRSNVASLLLGAATGLLWAPCAGPILGLILTTAILQGASANTSSLLLAYAIGAAVSLAVVSLLSQRVLGLLKQSLGIGEGVRRGLGGLMLASVVVIALGWDTTLLARMSASNTNAIEQALLDRVQQDAGAANQSILATATAAATPPQRPVLNLPPKGEFPGLAGATGWLNSPELSKESLRGKVVLVDFWTYSCINCLRAMPYVKAWAEKYKDSGLVVVGVHTPEFAFEKIQANVERAVREQGIVYPVAIDNNYAIWRAFNNRYWPAHYFIDATGQIRYAHFGEGDYVHSEQVIQQLLQEANQTGYDPTPVENRGTGTSAPSNFRGVGSPESYIGYARSGELFGSSPRVIEDQDHAYSAPSSLELNSWALDGLWRVGPEYANLRQASGRIVYRFQARDVHLVMGPGESGKRVRFRVRLDGHEPRQDHGTDIAPDGSGVVDAYRLYQLIRKTDGAGSGTVEIEFLDSDVNVNAFTFG